MNAHLRPEIRSAEAAGTRSDADGSDWTALPAPDFSFAPLASHLECEAAGQAFPSREALASLRAAGVPDRVIADQIITEAEVRFFARRRWDYHPGGVPALLLMVRDSFAEVVDVVAWPIARPDKWARLTAKAILLGEDALHQPQDGPVAAHRTPLGWLAGGGRGVCILDPTYAWKTLRTGPPLSGEDLAHAKELQAMLAPPEPPRVFVRQPLDRRKAA
ncbi:hypothetical protein J5J86_20770 [Aquabacter sp. L1I39]|uniref:hypothetical protein n=1 Tax=Aquabacter sp. L1I39 TaxID=2820278 RepID=UPI001AD96F3B|nr:hypothetical protein [Aquabacter sp. L1I39]QTL03159.1 hypothetical protein J5J86_20770 [Aquabacter sp. L1I39]